MFSSRKIIPVECDFGHFFQYLDKNFKSPTAKATAGTLHLRLRGYDLEINEQDARQQAQYFEILSEEKVSQVPGDRDDFYKDTNMSWGAFNEDWDFKRSIYISSDYERTLGRKTVTGCFRDRVFNELKLNSVEDNKVLLITGMAGVGKTTMLRRMAFDVYKSGQAPVVIIRSGQINFDYRLLAAFIESLNNQLNEKLPKGEHAQPVKPVIIFDDAATMIRHVNRIKDYLTARGRTALIIASERQGEWNMMFNTFPFTIQKDNQYELEEQLNDKEKQGIVGHFYDLGYISSKGILWDDVIMKELENSFFATVYTLVHPSRKPLIQIIENQYLQLTDKTQEAFRNICCFHRFNLPINLELLVRSLKCSYADFYSEVLGKDGAKVLFEDQDEYGNITYRTHHRIIASKTAEVFFGDPEKQKDSLLDILKEAVLTNLTERKICEKLMISHVGPNAYPKVFSYPQQRQLFEVVCDKYPIRGLVHHWGVLETDNDEYLEAERLLKWALQLPRDDIEAYRGESDQSILTSLGNLYSHKGIQLIDAGEKEKAEEYFQNAANYFRDAKHGEFANAHAYHADAFMWYQRGRRATEEPESLVCYAQALHVLTIAQDNLSEFDLQKIIELETLVWGQLGDELKIEQNIELLRDQYGTASGYYLCSQLLLHKAMQGEGGEKKRLLGLALEKIDEGLKPFPTDERCLSLRARIFNDLYPNELKKYYTCLIKWKAAGTTPSVRLLYELARTAFILTYYDDSKRFFRELDTGIGLGHRLRTRPRFPITDGEDNLVEFEGTIASIFSSYEGDIHCDSLRSLRYPIPFRPIACRFTPSRGDTVKLNISFNFLNPIAINVLKI